MSAAETTPPRLITHTDGDATFDHLLERQERREERSASSSPELLLHRAANPRSVPLVPALSPLSALANASFADDTGSPGSGSSTGSGVPCRGVVRGGRGVARAGEELFELFSAAPPATRRRRRHPGGGPRTTAWRPRTRRTPRARNARCTPRAAAAFGFAKKKPTARGRWPMWSERGTRTRNAKTRGEKKKKR